MTSQLFVLNSLDQVRAFVEGDPRRRDIFGEQLPLNSAPKISNISSPLTLGYKEKSAINGGDIVYYLDKQINVPAPVEIFGTETETVYSTAPFTPFKDLLIPHTRIKPDNKYIMRDMRKQSAFRQDLMASQQSWQNIHRPMFI